MKILDYSQRETMKMYAGGQKDLIDYSHWQRFLESVNNCMEINDHEFPDFVIYQRWLKEYPGWSHGKMDRDHFSWKPEYEGKKHPMNYYYDRMEKRLKCNS